MRRTADDFAAEMATRKAAHVNDGLMDLGVAIDTAVDELIDQNRREQQHGLSQHNPSDTNIISAAQEAAYRLITGHSWRDWVAVGRALQVGRTQAMGEAQTTKPEGKHYAAALSRWLSDAKLDRLLGRNAHKALRCRLLDLIDHIGAVERWRSTLPINRQLELNYPLTVWKHWQRATVVPDPNKQPKPSAIAKLKESVATLSEENHRLKEANGGSTITSRDSARDVVTVLRRIFSASKLEQIRKLLGKAE